MLTFDISIQDFSESLVTNLPFIMTFRMIVEFHAEKIELEIF